MRKLWLLIVLVAVVGSLTSACTSSSPRGDREFIPGRGWEPVE